MSRSNAETRGPGWREVTDVMMLLDGVRRGDAEAADRLVTLLYPLARGEAGRLLARTPTRSVGAEDVAQEAIFRTFMGLERCRSTAAPQVFAWVLTIIRRTTAEFLRASSARVARLSYSITPQDAGGWDHQGLGGEQSSEDVLIQVSLDVYSDLDEVAAAVVWSRLVAAAPWAEIAQDIGTTPGGAKRRFQRAQIAMRRAVVRRIDALPPASRALALEKLARLGFSVDARQRHPQRQGSGSPR